MKIDPRTALMLAAGAGLAYLAISTARAAGNVVGNAVDTVTGAVDATVSTPVYAIGDAVGLPRTSTSYAAQLMDQFDAAPWYEQAALSFKISAYTPAGDYLKWLADRTYRPA